MYQFMKQCNLIITKHVLYEEYFPNEFNYYYYYYYQLLFYFCGPLL